MGSLFQPATRVISLSGGPLGGRRMEIARRVLGLNVPQAAGTVGEGLHFKVITYAFTGALDPDGFQIWSPGGAAGGPK